MNSDLRRRCRPDWGEAVLAEFKGEPEAKKLLSLRYQCLPWFRHLLDLEVEVPKLNVKPRLKL